jgi:glycerate kinase
MVDLRHKVQSSDIVISGEGRLDNSSFEGKVVGGIHTLCEEYNKPLFLIVGDNICSENVLSEKGIKIATVSSLAQNLEDAQGNVRHYLKQITENFLKGIN